MACATPYAAGVTRVGTLKRISALTDFPAPGTGFRYAAYDFRVSLANLQAGSNPVLQVHSPVATVRYELTNRVNAVTTPTRQKIYTDGPVFGENNAVMRVLVTGAPGPWEVEFFLSTVPISV